MAGGARGHPSVRGEGEFESKGSSLDLDFGSFRVPPHQHQGTGDMASFIRVEIGDGSGPGGEKHSRVDADYPSPISSSITYASSSHVDVQQLVDSHERKQGCSVAEIHQRRNSLERLSETQTSRNNMEKKIIKPN